MSDSKNRASASKRRHARVIKVAPVTRAIRSALAISATTLALTASGAALAGTLTIPATTAFHYDVARRDVHPPVVDLTVVHDDLAPSSVYAGRGSDAWSHIAVTSDISAAGSQPAVAGMQTLGDVADLTAVAAASPGPGGVSGSDDSIGFYANYLGTGTQGFWVGSNTVTSTTGFADGAFITADNLWTVYTRANISATGYTWAAGIEIESPGYINDVRNENAITASASGVDGQAWGIYAAAGGNASIANNGTMNVSASGLFGTATGLYAASATGNAYDRNAGTINTSAGGDFGSAVGMEATTADGLATVYNAGTINSVAFGYMGTAIGGLAISSYGDAYAHNASTINAIVIGDRGLAIGLEASAYGAATVANSGSINASANKYSNAIGMLAYSSNGNAYVGNSSTITVNSAYGSAIGMYGYAAAGTVYIDNLGGITATSTDGLADGMFATGMDVEATNSGGITATGYTWAAGIEAQGSDLTTVTNDGGIVARATGTYGQAFGIYATGGQGGVSVTNNNGITALGNYATGIQVVSDGDVNITNVGGITAGDGSGYFATGIYATTNYEGADITVVNSGGISATSVYGSFGINVAALGTGSSASVTNAGGISAVAFSSQGYGATGVLVSADANASIVNSGGISVGTNGTAYGAVALAFNGDASVVNSGGISASGYDAYGAVASSSYGTASVDNSATATVAVGGAYHGQALVANGVAGATITNSGYVYASAAFAYGAFAQSGDGLAQITNTATGDIEVNGYFGIGAIGISTNGDVSINNAGKINAYGYAQGVGTFASSTYGDAATVNSETGRIYAYSYAGPGVGMFARATAGDASITNTGMAVGVSYYGEGTGARATGQTTEVTNSGLLVGASYDGSRAAGIDAYGSASVTIDNEYNVGGLAKYGAGAEAFGVYATSGGDISVTNGADGSMAAAAYYGYATGLLAYSFGGNVVVDNAGQIQAQGLYVATGVFAGADGAGTVTLTSSGSIIAEAVLGPAIGVSGSTDSGDLDLSSSGTIQATSQSGNAIGMSGYSSTGTSTLSNSGDITVYSHDGAAVGLASTSIDGDAAADNSGSINAASYSGNAIGISGYSASGDVSLSNSGSIETYSYAGSSIGMYGYSAAGDVNINNAAGSSINAYSYDGLADGIFASGTTVEVTNGGNIYANGYQWAAGIEAQGSDLVSVGNTGDISVVSYFGSHGYGVFATGGAGGATVTNDGTIEVVGSYATGIYAGANGPVSVTNTGSITVGSADYISDNFIATGIRALTNYDDSNIVVTNSGDIVANAYYGATGIDASALGDGSSVAVTNSGSIYAQQGTKYGYGAAGIVASATVDATVSNSASITTVSAGGSYGAMALAFSGTASVTNSGDITATSTAGKYYSAVGILSSSANGAAFADNSGNIVADASKYVGAGIQVNGNTGATATNSGSISVEAKYAYGILATAGQGDVAISNAASGDVYVTSAYNFAAGLVGISTAGDVLIDNAGSVQALAYGSAFGALAITDAGDATVTNSGTVYAYSYGGNATGVEAQAYGGVATVNNANSIDAYTAYVGATATGVAVLSDGTAHVVNSGLITAESIEGAAAIGVNAQGYGDVLVNNSGEINATDSDYAVAVRADSATGIATVVNSGILRTFSTLQGEVAISGGDGVQQVVNYGDIYGAIITAGGDDAVFNGDAGVWHVTNHTTDLGAGEDSITNGTGGRILVSNGGAIHTGADDDSIVNAAGGTIVLANGAIHMDASGSAGNDFVNDGRVLVKGSGLIDMGYAVALVAGPNALPLTNNGVLDMVDGATDDSLTINGDLGGSGSVNVDLNPLTTSADQLYVNGSVVGSQSVNVSLAGQPLSAHVDPIQFAQVSGDSTADSFVGGHVVGYDDSSFLDMTVNVISQIDSSNATADIFSVGLDVNGLNDAGSLGASVAAVSHGVMASQIGTWRQRVGVIPAKRDDQSGLSPWIRVFGDSGSVKLAHHADNFGGTGTFGFDQSNNGREFGMNVNIRGDLNIGLLAAKATGTQHLTGAGIGSDHVDSTAFGMYATWIAPNYYVDASYRWLDFDAHFRSAGGLQGTRGAGGAFNLEAGYTAWTMGGISITPEAQYTRSRVGDFTAIHGSSVDFVANGGASTRGRLGVEFSKTMDGAGWIWTPYGSVNAIREFDGESNYTIGNTFNGSTSTEGTSAMVELGLGVQKDGFSVTGGANWTDGGAFQGVLGGPVVVRYSW